MKKQLIPELVRVHAHLCGDGSVFIYKTKEKDRNFRAGIGYYNKNQRLLDNFRKDFSKLFGVKMKMYNNRMVTVSSIRIYNYLINRFGEFGSREWRISDEILNEKKEMKIEWLKSFFEDEAYHEKKYNRLKIKSVNFLGLRDIQKILNSCNIFSSLTGPNCDSSYYLTIPKFNALSEFESFIKEPVRK